VKKVARPYLFIYFFLQTYFLGVFFYLEALGGCLVEELALQATPDGTGVVQPPDHPLLANPLNASSFRFFYLLFFSIPQFKE
jgi:hypothetical protein